MTSPPLLIETWTGADGAPWPAGWTATNGGLAIQGNRGAITPPSAASYQNASAVHSLVAADAELTITFRLNYGGVIGFRDRRINIGLRTDGVVYPGRPDLPLTGYVLKLYMHPDLEDGWFIGSLHRFDGSGTNPDPRVPPPGDGDWMLRIEEAVDYRVRFRVVGGRIQARIWQAALPEPGSWMVDWREPGVPLPAGRTWLGVQSGWDGADGTDPGYRFDDLALTVPEGSVRVWNGTAEVPAVLRVA